MSPWLTRLVLDPRHRSTRTLLADGGRQHAWLMHLAPESLGDHPRRAAGLLFRVEGGSRDVRVLVQTTDEPRLDTLPMDGVLQAATRSLAAQLESIHSGTTIRYRIVANPTKRWGNSAPKKEMIGKLHTFRGPAAVGWWTERAPAAGLAILSADWRPLPDTIVKGRGHHSRAQFDGLATVSDPDAVRETIRGGLGRSRSYGCGLLSVALVGDAGRGGRE
ncbi:type I-E CRISPR-associated protein Cas6/Cse3/CasE [Glycomyces sp. NRRL B-16210]|uniref:type I-E CRISPR-associated protein Cas6/Cse3/CasE n=1 Tax=Glycomyces sp. NRRL B-16210 TaxID=1463821 RepID=UPI0004BE4BA4|nr:type I-E CRISPR-associated protein Cas6/Cse3/CasE [Glycomyces sp. NRRL B-16210]